MDTKKISIAAVVIAIIALVIVFVKPGVPGLPGSDGRNGRDGQDALGALSGPDIPYPYLSVGGGPVYQGKVAFSTGTTTVCSIQGPAADFRILSFNAYSRTGSTTETMDWSIATSTTPNASTRS